MVGPLVGMSSMWSVIRISSIQYTRARFASSKSRASAGEVLTALSSDRLSRSGKLALLLLQRRVLAPKEPVLKIDDALDHRGDHVSKGVGHFA